MLQSLALFLQTSNSYINRHLYLIHTSLNSFRLSAELQSFSLTGSSFPVMYERITFLRTVHLAAKALVTRGRPNLFTVVLIADGGLRGNVG